MRVKVLIVFLTIVASMSIVACSEREISFSKDVKPIFDAKCLDCHDGKGEGSEKTEFLVTDYKNIMDGTKFDAVVMPGSSVSSTLYRVVSHKTHTKIQMPPHHETATADGRGVPLRDKEIEIVKLWIDQGAKDN